MQTDLILSNITRHISISEEETNYFLSLLKVRELKKRELLLKAGDRCTTLNFVSSGALRAFYRDDDAKEATIMFAINEWWITDMACFVNQERTIMHIEAITKTCVLQLTKSDFDSLLVTIPKFERHFRILMQNAYIREQLRMLENLSLPADVRYHNFLEKYPKIIEQVPQKNIASYLGITPEFLSVIRKKKTSRIS